MSTDQDRPGTERDDPAATRSEDEESAEAPTSSEDVGMPGKSGTNEAAANGDAWAPTEDHDVAESDAGDIEMSEDGIRDLLRGALGKAEPEIPDVLSGVQRKLRQRSRGKFYADGWSTAKQPPINTYLITSLVMLAILFFVWAVLSPLSGEPASVEPPAPVNVIPGERHR